MGADIQRMTEEARHALPMRRLLEQNGSGPRGPGEKWNSFKCPFCGHKAATVFVPTGGERGLELFKCFHKPCPSENASMNEGQMVGRFAGVNDREGWKTWLKQAGVWKEERLPASVLPGSKRRKAADPLAVTTPSSPDENPAFQAEVREAREVILSEGRASVSLLQRRLRWGYTHASRVLDELERRGMVGPARGAEPREILQDEVGETKSGAALAPPANDRDREIVNFEERPDSTLEVGPDSSLKPAPEYPQPHNKQGSIEPGDSQIPLAGALQSGPPATGLSAENLPTQHGQVRKEGAPETPLSGDSRATPPGRTGSEQTRASSSSGESEFRPADSGASGDPNVPNESLNTDEKIIANLFVGGGGAAGGADAGGGPGAGSGGAGGGRGGGGGRGAAGGTGGGSGSGFGSDDARALMALQEFYGRIALHPEDEAMLLRKRGFGPGLCKALGYRSSRHENRAILEEMSGRWDGKILQKAGLFTYSVDAGIYKPSGKYFGLGLLGKKAKARKKEDGAEIGEDLDLEETEMEWGWCNPILIPYVNDQGELLQLRPHKDYVKGRGVHLYVARPVRLNEPRAGADVPTPKQELAVITEGEFKAGALCQVFRDALGIGAIPGISTSKKESMQKEILHWLALIAAKRVVVAFDNEEKGDPALASYKADPAKRHDTEVWARYLAGWLKREGFDATVAWLPAAWRDEKGKADWDGVLAARMNRAMRSVPAGGSAPGAAPGAASGSAPGAGAGTGGAPVLPTAKEAWESIRVEVRKEFLGVIESGHEPDEHPGLFDSQKERIVKNKLVRLRYEPKLPYGGAKEWKMAELMWRVARERDFDYGMRARALGDAYKSVQKCYYKRMPTKFGERERKLIEARKREAEIEALSNGNWDKYTFYDELLKGFPKDVADFKMDCRFVLVKGNFGDDRDRMVVLRNHLATSSLVALDAKSFTAPRDFKMWVTKVGPFCWNTGEQELEMLREDVNNLSAHMEAFEMTWFGWHSGSKLWVAKDCAITPQGDFLLPDDNGVIWWAESGYKMAERDSEGEDFVHRPPRWHPDKVLAFTEDYVRYRLMPRRNGEVPAEPEAIRDLFRELGFRLNQTQGCREGYLMLGHCMAYAAAPEFYAREGFFPGIWFSGERGSGKTTLARVVMACWGYELDSGANLHSGTKVGMQILAQQFCNLPIWYEEYKNTLDSFKIEFIKSTYNRELSAKKEFGGVRRLIRTAPLVVGEHTSTDGATQQRFPHVNIAKQKREAEHKKWFQENFGFFFSLGRQALLHRERYVQLFEKWYYEVWSKDPDLANAEDRSREVYGVCYAGYMAMAELLGCVVSTEEEGFRRELIAATMRAVRDSKEVVNINVFWQTLLVAWKAGEFGRGENAKRFFKTEKILAPDGHPPGASNQQPGFDSGRSELKPWYSYRLYIDFASVIAKLEEYLRKGGKVMPLTQRDLREQLSKESYWVAGKGDGHKQRMGMSRVPVRVWCVDLDRFKEFGYQPVSDEELMKSRENGLSDWMDPRHGELYQICLEVERENFGDS